MKRSVSLILLMLFILLFTSCTAEKSITEQFFAMDTVMSITCGDQKALSAAKEEILRLDARIDAENPESELSAYNSGKMPSSETLFLIDSALDYCALTDGCLDITLRPASHAWGFGETEQRVPSEEELASLREITGWEKLSRGEAPSGGMQVDLGAVAKGYASDRAAEILEEYGISSAIISLGGNIRAVGSKPDGSDFVIGIQDPENADRLAMSIAVSDTSVITSGSYQRYFEENGIRYHHILDPATLRPAESGLVSVSVICKTGLYADALSTALFVMGKEDAVAFYREYGDFDMILIDNSANIFYTEGISPKDLSDGHYQYQKISKIP